MGLLHVIRKTNNLFFRRHGLSITHDDLSVLINKEQGALSVYPKILLPHNTAAVFYIAVCHIWEREKGDELGRREKGKKGQKHEGRYGHYVIFELNS